MGEQTGEHQPTAYRPSTRQEKLHFMTPSNAKVVKSEWQSELDEYSAPPKPSTGDHGRATHENVFVAQMGNESKSRCTCKVEGAFGRSKEGAVRKSKEGA